MPSARHQLISLLLGLTLTWGATAADTVAVNPAHPDRYTVVRGDTLWDIAGRFLREPWRWPEVWHVNPQIRNPHLIYPGDIITMTWVNGQPRLSLQPGSTVKLTPEVRSTPLDGAIPAIPVDAVRQFLSRPFVVDQQSLDQAPYVVHFADGHILGSTNIKAYIRAIETKEHLQYHVVRPGKPYRDGESGELLGYEALFVGNAELQRIGDPATVLLTGMQLETVIGDRLFPADEDVPLETFYPKAPDQQIEGRIISVLNGVSQIGQFNVVVLDRGDSDGLAVGDVMNILHKGREVRDVVTPRSDDTVTLPDEPAGTLLVFRTFPRVSFALIMQATRPLNVGDRVINPL
ncbi:MAG: peptidoglycan-binding protein LysM [Candidatus Sedimenticola endophacoides]|uniref:LysM domain-containing protein n=1 Tax=Candidatus Sedimenticola endophacoides TaxID=2548426 RepID=A0A6N4E3R0_9GAMM|nr:MAG: peptidoglycan-binding protein LysM [Candidatus Sedimenticola endophacoides]OQX34424.1 MAG: peptidoglycan-binding protein LysM [Candidatus Sedimenticola endophacoides]OQX41939.1 MAG: peptidoglycan-binding protein LysM [Candidatus Sedimenticola endophacoides]OQX49453.1 MAG: peptidoglycan-binding protein LysM [Candidatus Sedimenticola endophacoides]PUD99663.1 MAG: LysM domain-containing protein [Candidatus Sedimenticola endophacoides]